MTERKPSVLVMMATYNGEKHLADQVESILAQEGVDVSLMICDDGSSDSTIEMCERLAATDSRVSFERNARNKGPAQNFMDMLCSVDPYSYDYFAFSDQDDYWLPEKLIEAIRLMEGRGSAPLLYYSDVCNADEDLGNPRMEFAKFAPGAKNVENALAINCASGCTEVLNQEMCRLIQLHAPERVPIYHDQWVNVVALACADTLPDLDRSFIRRRITGDNVMGAREKVESLSFMKKTVIAATQSVDHCFTDAARMILEDYSDQMHPRERKAMERFVRGRHSLSARLRMAVDGKYQAPTPLENLILHVRLLMNRF